MPHQTSDVRRLAEGGIAYNVEIGESSEAKRFTDTVATGFLHIAEQLRVLAEPQAGEERKHTRGGVLRLRREAVGSLVRRVKGGMPLGNKIGLSGDPNAVRLRVREHHRRRISLLTWHFWNIGRSRCGRRLLRAQGASRRPAQGGKSEEEHSPRL